MKNSLIQALFIGSSFVTMPLFNTVLSTKINGDLKKDVNIQNDHYSYKVKSLRDAIKVTRLGAIIVPEDIIEVNLQEKISLIKRNISKFNPDVNLAYLDLIKVTETSAIVISEKDESEYFGTARVSFSFEKQRNTEDERDELIYIENDITEDQLGVIKLKNDIQKTPTDIEILNKLLELNFKVWKDNLIVTNITKSRALVYGDGQYYRGKKYVYFTTVKVFNWHETLVNLPKTPSDSSSFYQWHRLINDFLVKISQDTWTKRNNQTFWTLKNIIESNVFNYFSKKININTFFYHEGESGVVRIPESYFKTSYIENRSDLIFHYKIEGENNTWSQNLNSIISQDSSGINESLKISERIRENQRPSYVVKTSWNSDWDLVTYVDNNKDNLIASFLKSERFKIFKPLYELRRIRIEFATDYANWILRERKLILNIYIDQIRDANFSSNNQVMTHDHILFEKKFNFMAV